MPRGLMWSGTMSLLSVNFSLADAASAVLGHNLAVEHLAHLPVRAQFAVSARVLGIVDAPNTHLVLASFL